MRRLASIAYDLLLVMALLMVLTGLVFLARAGAAFDPSSGWYRALLLTAAWAYFALSWTRGGQTVGMRAWRLVVTDKDGSDVDLVAATIRYLAGWLSTLAAGLGFVWCLVDRDRLTWHDRISRTRLRYRPSSAKAQNGDQRSEE